MSPDNASVYATLESRIAALKVDYILNAIHLADSFVHQARKHLESSDASHAARAREHAEYFYLEAREVLTSIETVDLTALKRDLERVRESIDALGVRAQFASA